MLLDSIIRALPIIDATMLPMYTVQGRRNESNFGKPFIREPRLIVHGLQRYTCNCYSRNYSPRVSFPSFIKNLAHR